MRIRFPTVSASRAGRLKSLDWALLIGIVAVVVIVSLPRLSAFARGENETDARQLLRRFAELLGDEDVLASPPRDVHELFERLPRASRRQFQDQVVLEDGRVILRHGYCFELLRLAAFEGDPRGVFAVRAWPERCAAPDAPCYVAFARAPLLCNVALDPQPCGLDRPAEVATPHVAELAARGWNPLPASGLE